MADPGVGRRWRCSPWATGRTSSCLLGVYRSALGLSDAEATAILGVYVLGLIPGLLIGGRASDVHGRKRLMIIFAALSLVATTVPINGQ